MPSSNTNNERQNDIQVLIEKQKMQFRVLKEVLKDSLNTLGSALNSVGKLSKSVDNKIEKINSAQNITQPEDLNRIRKKLDASSSDPKRGKEFWDLQIFW